jgi:TRAP-type C4-dicarboxylate transport system permease small subunit
MALVERIDGWIARAEGAAVVLLLAAMVALSFAQVVLRNFFDTGLTWADVLLRHQVLWIGFIGASLATRQSRHIGVDVLSRVVSGRRALALRAVLAAGAAVVCTFLTHAGATFVRNEREAADALFGDVPAWPFQLVIPAAFALMGLRFLVQVFDFAAACARNDLSRLPRHEGRP